MSLVRTVFPLRGGLNTASPPLDLPPGCTSAAVNYELLAKGGYRRINGYALYDGQDENQAAVPGEGPIRGVWVYDGDVYAFRDHTSEGRMYVATAGGWNQVSLGSAIAFHDGSTAFSEGDTITGGTSGATATVERVVLASGIWGSGNAVGSLVLSSISGTFQANEDLEVSATPYAKATADAAAITLPKGGLYSFVNNNFYGSSTTKRMYGANGVGDAFEFDGTVFAPISLGLSVYPDLVQEFKSHLVLGFSEGSLQISATGSPLTFSGLLDAVEIATGDEIQDLSRLPGGVLGVGCRQSIQLLYGNDSTDFQLQVLNNFGVRGRTMTGIYNDSYVLTDQGVQMITPTQDFGDFSSTAITQFIEDTIVMDIRTSAFPLSVISRNRDQYRLFFGQKGYYFTFDGTTMRGIMPVIYDHEVLCVCNGVDADDQEILFFGSTDGQVFQMESGYTFNGEPILSTIQLPFYLENAGQYRKRFRRAIFGVRTEGQTPSVSMQADFQAYDAETTATQQLALFMSGDEGVLWDEGDWDEVEWGEIGLEGQAQARMDGVGQHIFLTIFNDGTQNGLYTLNSVTLLWMPRALLRG